MTGACTGVRPDDLFPELDGSSPALQRLKHDMACVAADRDITVLLLGESGTGKERVARAIHRASPRGGSPFVVVNCAGLSSSLIEDELFGHVRGAFTGAVDDRPGPFERATGGTIVLDEIGDLTADLQMKLLRVLQERVVQRLGGRSETAFDVRVIAATNMDLSAATARKRFREDLYYRLNVFGITVPPLRQRGAADITALAGAILHRFALRRRRWPVTFDEDVLTMIGGYTWPGNVRELENVVERMLVAAGPVRTLTRAHLPPGFAATRSGFAGDRASHGAEALPGIADVRDAMARHGFNQARAAADLGISRHQLYRVLKRDAGGSGGCGCEPRGDAWSAAEAWRRVAATRREG